MALWFKLGDGVMCFFAAPRPSQSLRACHPEMPQNVPRSLWLADCWWHALSLRKAWGVLSDLAPKVLARPAKDAAHTKWL